MSSQLLATWKGYMDEATYPGTLTTTEEIVGQSAILSVMMGKNLERTPNAKGDMQIKFNKTWNKGSEKRIKINKREFFTSEDEMNDLAVEFGDDAEPMASARDVITGSILPATLGYTQEWTEDEIMEISGYSNQERADWILDQQREKNKYIGLHLAKQIYQGAPKSGDTTQGQVLRYSDGVARKSIIGLSTICSGDDYAGLSTTDWQYWTGQNWDMGSALFNYAAADMDTVAELIVPATGRKVPRILDILESCYSNLDTSQKYFLMVNPKIYQYIIKPCTELFRIPGIVASSSGDSYGVFGLQSKVNSGINFNMPETFTIAEGRLTIVPEPARLGTQYVLPLPYMYFINQRDLTLEAWANKNFVEGEWDITTKYGTMMRKTEAAIRFYASKRWNLGRIALDSAVVAELAAYTGDIYSSKTA